MATSTPIDDDQDWNEAFDASIPRMDLVGRAANGSPGFLLMKADGEGGLMPPDVVRDLIAKATPEPPATMTATTYTGHPRDVMAAIHAASNPTARKETPMSEPVLKADDAQDAADAVIGDDQPLPDADDLNADAQPSADGSGVPTDATGDPDDPSSPAWEAVDAARARQALQLTIALQRLVAQSADREAQEVATSDDGDMSDVWTLEDVGCAIDAIIDMLAPFAVTEQAEADQGTADTVMKAGRVLSSANEAKIHGAVEALQSVLAALPAPVNNPEDAAAVAKATKETSMDAQPTTEAVTEPVTDVTKAKGDPQVAVYTADGKLVGTVDQADVNPIASADAPDGGDTDAPADDAPPMVQPDATDGPAAAPADPAAAPPAPETPAAPAADDDTVKKAASDQHDLLMKSMTDAIKEALTPLEDRLAKMEAQDMPNQMPMLNGATPGGALALRGQDGDAEVGELRKAWQDETNPTRKQELQMQLAAHMVRNAPRTQ